jgi:hypothetical protein
MINKNRHQLLKSKLLLVYHLYGPTRSPPKAPPLPFDHQMKEYRPIDQKACDLVLTEFLRQKICNQTFATELQKEKKTRSIPVKQKIIQQERKHHVVPGRVGKIEPAMITWCRAGIKKALKQSIFVCLCLLVEDLGKGDILKFCIRGKATDQKANVVELRASLTKCRSPWTDIKLPSMGNLRVPMHKICMLEGINLGTSPGRSMPRSLG